MITKIAGEKVVAWEWLSGIDTVGFVVIEVEPVKKYKCYFGVARNTMDEEADLKNIIEMGCRVPTKIARSIFNHLEDNWYEG